MTRNAAQVELSLSTHSFSVLSEHYTTSHTLRGKRWHLRHKYVFSLVFTTADRLPPLYFRVVCPAVSVRCHLTLIPRDAIPLYLCMSFDETWHKFSICEWALLKSF